MNVHNRTLPLILATIGGLIQSPAVASVVLPPEIEVRCGVLFTLQAQQSYASLTAQFSSSFQGSGWSHVILYGYMPFALLENKTNTTVVLRGAGHGPPSLQFSQPKLALRLKRVGTSASDYITQQPVSLRQIYYNTYSNSTAPKEYQMFLYGMVDQAGKGTGSITLAPGQSMMLTKGFSPNEPFNESNSFFDWRNTATQDFEATPGFRGAEQAFCADYLTGGTANVTPGVNGHLKPVFVVATRLADAWDVELTRVAGTPSSQIHLYPATTLPADWRNCFPEASRVPTFRLTDHIPAKPASEMCSSATTLMKDRVVQPLALAKAALDHSYMLASPDPTADPDHDGMDDAWEAITFGSEGAEPQDDPDHDGYSNLFEFLAGTSPVDVNDWFQHSLVRSGQSTHNLKWTSVPGRSYRIETSDNLADWQTVATVAGAATPAITTEYTLPINGDRRYYRLHIESPF